MSKRDEQLSREIPEFMHKHKDLLLIVCDPKTDTIFASYKDSMISGKIKSPTGKNLEVVRNVLRASRFEDTQDLFFTSLIEVLQLPVRKGNQFLMFLDAALFNIAKSLRKRKSGPIKGAVKSPFVERVEKGRQN